MTDQILIDSEQSHSGGRIAPPTTDIPSTRVSASPTALVPAANGAISKTPIGPFHTTVSDSSISCAKRAADSGPMSRPSSRLGRLDRNDGSRRIGSESIGNHQVSGKHQVNATLTGVSKESLDHLDLISLNE